MLSTKAADILRCQVWQGEKGVELIERNDFLPCHINENWASNDVICSRMLACKSTPGKSALIVTHVHSPKAQKLLRVCPREQDGSSQSRP